MARADSLAPGTGGSRTYPNRPPLRTGPVAQRYQLAFRDLPYAVRKPKHCALTGTGRGGYAVPMAGGHGIRHRYFLSCRLPAGQAG